MFWHQEVRNSTHCSISPASLDDGLGLIPAKTGAKAIFLFSEREKGGVWWKASSCNRATVRTLEAQTA